MEFGSKNKIQMTFEFYTLKVLIFIIGSFFVFSPRLILELTKVWRCILILWRCRKELSMKVRSIVYV